MCGRMVLTRSADEIAGAFEVALDSNQPALSPRYNVAPGQNIAAIRREAGEERCLVELSWGLIPFWAK